MGSERAKALNCTPHIDLLGVLGLPYRRVGWTSTSFLPLNTHLHWTYFYKNIQLHSTVYMLDGTCFGRCKRRGAVGEIIRCVVGRDGIIETIKRECSNVTIKWQSWKIDKNFINKNCKHPTIKCILNVRIHLKSSMRLIEKIKNLLSFLGLPEGTLEIKKKLLKVLRKITVKENKWMAIKKDGKTCVQWNWRLGW